MPLPLTVSCFSKIQIGFTFVVPAHPGSHGKRAVKRACVCVRPRPFYPSAIVPWAGDTCTYVIMLHLGAETVGPREDYPGVSHPAAVVVAIDHRVDDLDVALDGDHHQPGD